MSLSTRRILATWWPLALSWLMMSLEMPAVSAVMARLLVPDISLAAYGGVVFPLALIIEAPIIMLLAASTALCRDWASYVMVRRFMVISAGLLTVLHVVLVATPLYDLVVGTWIGAPEVIREPARIGLAIMTPWTAAIAYRRFQQGVLIRFGASRAVTVGTGVRLAAIASVLAIGALYTDAAGIVVGTSAVAAGVVAEAIFVGFRVHPILVSKLMPARPVERKLTPRRFAAFYTPLALTTLITLLAHPIMSAGLARMPRALDSLAVWPVMSGLVFMFRALGFSYNEVVVALLDEPDAKPVLRRFSWWLAGGVAALLLLFCITPAAWVWFRHISGLGSDLAELGVAALWIAIPLPAIAVLISWHQGALVHMHRTRAVTESVLLGLVITVTVLVAGVAYGKFPGLNVLFVGAVLSGLMQVVWLAYRRTHAEHAEARES